MNPLTSILAQSELGAKPDLVVQAPSSPSGVGIPQIFQILLALGIVVALLKWGLPALLKRKQVASAKSTSPIFVGEPVAIGNGTLHIVETEERRFLVGATGQAINLVAELNQVQDEQAFFELLDKSEDSGAPPNQAAVLMPSEAESALDRLQKLTG